MPPPRPASLAVGVTSGRRPARSDALSRCRRSLAAQFSSSWRMWGSPDLSRIRLSGILPDDPHFPRWWSPHGVEGVHLAGTVEAVTGSTGALGEVLIESRAR